MISDAIKILALTLVWALMSRHLDWLSILGGLIVSTVALRIGAQSPRILFSPAFGSLGQLLYFLLRRIVFGSLAVVRAVISPHKLSPAIIAVPLETAHESPAAMLGNILTLTPGSVTIHADLQLQRLYMHSLFVSNPSASAEEARREFGDPIANLLKEEE